MDTEKRKIQKAEAQRNWYKKNKEKAKKAALERYSKNKNEINAKRKQQRIDNPEEVRAKAKSYYNPITNKENGWKNAGIKNMSYEKYLLMLDKQSNLCDICGKHQNEFKRNFDVDHNHDTGKARGLLCTPCNSGMGKLKDSVEMLERAIKYLKKHE